MVVFYLFVSFVTWAMAGFAGLYLLDIEIDKNGEPTAADRGLPIGIAIVLGPFMLLGGIVKKLANSAAGGLADSLLFPSYARRNRKGEDHPLVDSPNHHHYPDRNDHYQYDGYEEQLTLNFKDGNYGQ